MFQELPVHQDNLFAFRVTGRLAHSDYQAFLPRIEELIARYGRISLFIELEGFRGWDLEAAKDDFRFGLQHRGDFERIAMVGDSGTHTRAGLYFEIRRDGVSSIAPHVPSAGQEGGMMLPSM